MSTVNIIMATYNGEKYVSDQIKSILSSVYTDWSLFIFDDGSLDDTIHIAKSFEERYPERIRVFQNEKNLGVTKNFLKGLKQVYEFTKQEKYHEESMLCTPSSSNQAEYFMFSDQDDIWHKDKINITLERMRYMEKRYGRDRAQLIFTDAAVVNENLEMLASSFFRSQHLIPYRTDLSHMLMENKCNGCTMMVNRALLSYLTQIPEKARYHDGFLGLIAASFGYISFLPIQTMDYRQHGKNVVGGVSFLCYAKKRFTAIFKQRESIHASIEQAREFLAIYDDSLKESKRRQIHAFIGLEYVGFFKRRYLLLRYGFLKTGFLRNMGLFLII